MKQNLLRQNEGILRSRKDTETPPGDVEMILEVRRNGFSNHIATHLMDDKKVSYLVNIASNPLCTILDA